MQGRGFKDVDFSKNLSDITSAFLYICFLLFLEVSALGTVQLLTPTLTAAVIVQHELHRCHYETNQSDHYGRCGTGFP